MRAEGDQAQPTGNNALWDGEPEHDKIANGPARVNPYDDCILEHTSTAQNEAAAYAIERAYISKTSIPITTTPASLATEGKAWADYFKRRC